MARTTPPPAAFLDRLRRVCLDLPEAVEEQAWVGTRWVVRKKTFAHVLTIARGQPPAYAKAAGTQGPACVLTFRAPVEVVAWPRLQRAPFFKPVWFRDIAGVVLDEQTDWDEVEALLVRSFRLLAPKKLAAQVER